MDGGALVALEVALLDWTGVFDFGLLLRRVAVGFPGHAAGVGLSHLYLLRDQPDLLPLRGLVALKPFHFLLL